MTPFDARRYLGVWYQVAAIPALFSIGCQRSKAEYALRSDGIILVSNTCVNKSGKIRAAQGTAHLLGENVGLLEVSFGIPFIGEANYRVLETDYEHYALVGGKSKDYLWILSRNETLPQSIYYRLVERAKQLGYHVEALRLDVGLEGY